MKVSVGPGETPTSLRISAPISPAASARPTPIMTTSMIVTAEKFLKLSTNEVNRKRTPEPVRSPLTLAVSVLILYELAGWYSGFVTFTGSTELP